MNIFRTIALLLASIVVLSCRIQKVDLQEYQDKTAMVIPSVTSAPTETLTAPPTENDDAQKITPTIYPPIGSTTKMDLANGLIWTECVVEYRAYSHVWPDVEALSRCTDLPETNEHDDEIRGERFEQSRFPDLRIEIGDDIYETRYKDTKNCCEYDLEKNGNKLLHASAPFYSFDPNRNLWNIDGQLVWELISEPPDIIVDGVHYTEKYGSEGVFFPYEIKGKLIFIAKENGKFHIVYAGETVGLEYDEISMAYCCAMMSVMYGSGQYWFLGRRDGVMYVVTIQ